MAQFARILVATLPVALALAQGPWASCPAAAAESGAFQVAFVTRLQSIHLTPDSRALVKQGLAESLQATEPGVVLGTYRGRVLLDDPETDPANGLFKVSGLVRTPLGSLTWTALVRILEDTSSSDQALGWSYGRITGGTGLFARARGTVEITGRQLACEPESDEFCAAPVGDPGVGERQDFHVVLRGKIGAGGVAGGIKRVR